MRHPELLELSRSVLLLVDAQERLLPAIEQGEHLIGRMRTLLRAGRLLKLPIIVTEQYPKGLGHTLAELAEILVRFEPIEKTAFSACGGAAVIERIKTAGAVQVLLSGVEAHVCVQQTALDLAAADLKPYVIADAVGSRCELDKSTALRRMDRCGVTVTTLEAALFELMVDSKHEAFKEISRLIK